VIDEIERYRRAGTSWALLHVLVSLPELPLIGGITFSVTNTCSPNAAVRPM
jgi:hypothetical protein